MCVERDYRQEEKRGKYTLYDTIQILQTLKGHMYVRTYEVPLDILSSNSPPPNALPIPSLSWAPRRMMMSRRIIGGGRGGGVLDY